MIRRFSLVVLMVCVCCSQFAVAADLPLTHGKNVTQGTKANIKPKKPAATRPLVSAASVPDPAQPAVNSDVSLAPAADELDMSWVLDPLVANADGGKHEDSASSEGNLVVVEPDFLAASQMTIELSGHIVKEADTTARIDVVVGSARHTINWTTDDVQAGRFKFQIEASLSSGKLPDTIPVSALAFVTRSKDAGAVMVSLEKITVRMGRLNLAEAQ